MSDVWVIIFWVSAGTLAYVLCGYWIITLVASRFFRQHVEDEADSSGLPVVSIVIPAYNEAGVLEQKLQNTLAIDYPRESLEILVASDGSSDETNEIGASFADRGVRLLAFEQRRGKASAVNDAVAAAKGEFLCLCDANVMFRSDALQRLVAGLRDPDVGAVTGDVRLASDEANFGQGEGLYYAIEKRLQLAESRVGSLMGVDGGMYVLRSELYQPLPADTILDDFVISMRVLQKGKRVVFAPDAVATENGTPTAMQEYRRRVRVAAGAVQSIKRREWPPFRHVVQWWQYASHKLLRWMGPIWLALLLIANVALWSHGTLYRTLLVCQLIAYGIAAVGLVSLRFRATMLGGVAFYFVLSHVAMAVGSIKGIFNLQKVTWRRAERSQTPRVSKNEMAQ